MMPNCQVQITGNTGWFQSTEEFITATCTQDSSQAVVKAKLVLDKGQQMYRVLYLELLWQRKDSKLVARLTPPPNNNPINNK